MRAGLVALAASGIFLLTALRHLDVVPRVFEDEPWQASTAYKLATQGVFGSDLFVGYFAMDQRYYDFLPLQPLIEAGFFRVLGLGLFQARLETVVVSMLILVLTFSLGWRLASVWVGALAVVLLVFMRWSGLTYVLLTGIPLVDLARIARYDPLVPVLGLAAVHLYLSARARARAWLFLGAGLLAGLAGLAHLYGLFWVPALVLLAVWDRRRRFEVACLVVGALLPWLPYAAYVAADVPDWRGQTVGYADRFDVLSPRWYVDNVVQEVRRYRPGMGSVGLSWLARPGVWFLLAAAPLSLGWLARRAIRQPDLAARAIVVPALLFPLCFALFITSKVVNYTLIELPLVCLAIAWASVAMWQRPRGRPWARTLLSLAILAVVVEGGTRLGQLEADAQTTTPYASFIGQVRALIPPNTRVLGLHTYWFGLQDVEYRSFLVPLYWADAGLPLDEGLARVEPDVVLIDPRLRDYFAAPESAVDAARFGTWLRAHDGALIGQVDDPTYGLMEVYRVARLPAD